MIHREFAPAKINLYLHVGRVRSDGYHPIESWMVFADIGDEVSFTSSDTLEFAVSGPYAGQVPDGEDNLVVRARDRAFDSIGGTAPTFALHLEKILPPASGLGGGSSDAAAVLRLIRDHAGGAATAMQSIAARLGADVPACLQASSVIARGRGERLSPGFPTAPLNAVLVNPGVSVSTAAVFTAYDQEDIEQLGQGPAIRPLKSITEVVSLLSSTGNDLEAPAITLQPAIAQVLTALRAQPQTRLARMSGSGATCFALCDDADAAAALAAAITAQHPDWWVRATVLS